MVPAAETIFNSNQAFWWDAARIIEDDFTFPLYENFKPDQKHQKGKQNSSLSDNSYGYPISAVPANGDYSDIAPDATLRAASFRQAERRAGGISQDRAILVKPSDIMKRVRIRRNISLIVFVVDLSWSMAVAKRMAATKKAIISILTKAYQSRDDVCLITFQKDQAKEVVPPTHSVALAEKYMQQMQVGGKTPLSAGLRKALETMDRACRSYKPENIFMVLLSDCEGNISQTEEDPMEEAFAAAEKIASGNYRTLVINSDPMTFGQGYANRMAKRLKASCYLISDLNSDRLLDVIRGELIL